jgi:hypothetical protein
MTGTGQSRDFANIRFDTAHPKIANIPLPRGERRQRPNNGTRSLGLRLLCRRRIGWVFNTGTTDVFDYAKFILILRTR